MLTLRQEKFITELLKGKSQREAYKAAYDVSKMKDKSIDERACRLFKDAKIQSRYTELRDAMIQKDVDDAESIRKMIIEQEKAILNANMGDLFDVVADEEGLLIQKAKSPEALAKFDMRAVKSYKFDRSGHILLELYDKQPAVTHLKDLFGLSTIEEKEDIKIVLQDAEEYSV